MLAKSWKKIGLIILIIACIVNIGVKLASKVSFDEVITDIKSSFNKEEAAPQQNNVNNNQ